LVRSYRAHEFALPLAQAKKSLPNPFRNYTYSTIAFSLSDPVADEVLLTFFGGFPFFSGLPSLIVKDLSALLVRFLAEPSSVGGDVGTGLRP